MSGSESRLMFVFPGQGSQYRGIGSDLHEELAIVRDTYTEASDVLGYDVRRLSFEDPDGQIDLTRHTQPVLMTHQVACFRAFQQATGGSVTAVLAGGHSLGEYTALVAAGSLGFADGLRLVKRRGELMGEYGEGGMLALPLDLLTARPLADLFYCQVASINLPEQTVVGGADADLDALAAEVELRFPRKRAVKLVTEGAFHTYLMVTAARHFREVLDATGFHAPTVPVLSNYTGELHDTDPASIRTRLFFQLFNPVNWVGCLTTAMGQGVTGFIEFGGGIGKGEGPAEKRPNLESIIKKTLRASGYEAGYQAVINSATLREACGG
jgi:[acyl-carrier-protein] S-malonyltransferase